MSGINKETWVLVADAARSYLLRLDPSASHLHLLSHMKHDASRAKASELLSDRQGRTFDSSHVGVRHAMEPRHDPKRAEQQRFARQLAHEVDKAALASRFQELVLVAPPSMLGDLRAALSDRARQLVQREVDSDLAGLDLPELQRRLVALLA
jgi:protein required for attachment to host cells